MRAGFASRIIDAGEGMDPSWSFNERRKIYFCDSKGASGKRYFAAIERWRRHI
jgi:hypothetical protein